MFLAWSPALIASCTMKRLKPKNVLRQKHYIKSHIKSKLLFEIHHPVERNQSFFDDFWVDFDLTSSSL